jgi:hypothetical protein
MRKLLATLMAAVGFAQSAEAGPATQLVDPDKILFSTPTIANDLPPLDPITGQRPNGVLALHEDEWTQNEFLPEAMLPEVQRMLKEFKTFEAENRVGSGWRNIYVRELNRAPLMAGNNALVHLQSVLGAKAGPAPLVTSVEGVARVRNGFTFEIGRNVHLYGYSDEGGIPVIAADLGPNPEDQRLTEVFAKLNASDGLIFVDWRQQMLLVSATPDGKIAIWRP